MMYEEQYQYSALVEEGELALVLSPEEEEGSCLVVWVAPKLEPGLGICSEVQVWVWVGSGRHFLLASVPREKGQSLEVAVNHYHHLHQLVTVWYQILC